MSDPEAPPHAPSADAGADHLDPVRAKVLAAVLDDAAFDGWSEAVARGAAERAGVSASDYALAFPQGVRDVLDYFAADADRRMAAQYGAADTAAMRVRDRVTFLVEARLAALADHKEAARRAAAFLALPFNAALGARLAARTADAMWRALGDRSADFNYYSKRAILTGVYVSTLTVWFSDADPDMRRTRRFLAGRISNVMQFEAVKRTIRKLPIDPRAPLTALSWLRYGPPRGRRPGAQADR